MPTGIQETTDVPENKLAQVVRGYELDHPTKIEKIKQPNGMWTVRATFPDETPNNT